MTFGGGVDAIGLVEAVDAADAFEEEGNERGLVGFRDRGENGGVVARVGFAHAARHLHADDDELGVRIFRANAVEDGLKILARDGGFDAAETVVGAESEHEDVDGLAENPVDAASATGGGFAAEAGVDDAVREFCSCHFFLDTRGVGFGKRIIEAITGGEAVAEEDDGFGGGRGRVGVRGAEGGNYETDERHEKQEDRPRRARKGAKV